MIDAFWNDITLILKENVGGARRLLAYLQVEVSSNLSELQTSVGDISRLLSSSVIPSCGIDNQESNPTPNVNEGMKVGKISNV